MKPILVLLLPIFYFFTPNVSSVDIIDQLSAHFKSGNAKEIAKSFDTSVELIIIDQEDVYNKAQSEQILKDFFVKNQPLKTIVIHKLNNNPNYRLGIFTLFTKTGRFRVTITMALKKPGNNFLITELRIEPDKE
jgi:hypothetical protein